MVKCGLKLTMKMVGCSKGLRHGGTAHRENALRVPMIAVGYDPIGAFVYALKGQHFQKQRVKLGENDGRWMTILSGLTTEDVVATAGRQKIFQGASQSLAPEAYDSHFIKRPIIAFVLNLMLVCLV